MSRSQPACRPPVCKPPVCQPIEILLVEDNFGDVLLTRQAFEKSKLANRIAVAEDGEQALSMLRREGKFRGQPRPDLILLDLGLPRLDGTGVLRAIRQDPALKDIAVVILSGSRAQIEIAHGQAPQANGHIVKPVDFRRLEEIVAGVKNLWFMVVSLPGGVGWAS